MIVQDPLSGYLHEVPDALAYYNGYDEYVDPNVAEYSGELGEFGLWFLPKIIRSITGGGGGSSPPPPPPAQPASAAFVPTPGMRAYIVAVVKDVLSKTQPAPGQMLPQASLPFRRRRRR